VNEIVKFNCDRFTIIEDDPRFITCKFYFGLIGENANGSVLLKEDYENNKDTIGYTPICGYFKGKDFGEHDPKEYPMGGLLSFADCEYSYEEYENKIYAVAKGIIQKEYLNKEAENVLKSETKKISIEIEVLEKEKLSNGKFRFKKWIYQCITILGDKYTQGMGLAHLEVLNKPREKYAIFVSKTIESFSEKENNNIYRLKINLTKESTDFDTSWSEVDKISLRDKIMGASNYKILVKKCYLMVLPGYEDAPSEKLKYPICMIKDNTLILSVKGCESALSYLEKNTDDPNYQSAKNKLSKYYKILGLSTENFIESEGTDVGFNKTEFALLNGMTSNQIEGIFEDQCKSAGLDCWISDWSDKYVFIYDYKSSMHKAIPYTMEENTFKLDFANYKKAISTQVWLVDGDDEGEIPETDMIQQMVASIMDKMASEKSTMEETMTCDKAKMEEQYTLKVNELTEANEKFAIEKNEFSEKISQKDESILKIGQELDELKEKYSLKETEVEALKSDITKFAKDKKESEAETILAKYSKKISEEERTELFSKLEKFSSVEDFEKEVKAFVCDKYESEIKGKDISTYSRLGLPPVTNEEVKTNNEHWTSYISEYVPQVQK